MSARGLADKTFTLRKDHRGRPRGSQADVFSQVQMGIPAPSVGFYSFREIPEDYLVVSQEKIRYFVTSLVFFTVSQVLNVSFSR